MNSELARAINERQTARGETLGKNEQNHLPENCESLIEGSFSRRLNAKDTNALTCVLNKLVEQIVPLSVESERLQEAQGRCLCLFG